MPADLGMTARTLVRSVMMTEPAFQRLEFRPVQFAQIVAQERTTMRGMLVGSETLFIAFEGRREDAESIPRPHFEHHTIPISSLQG
ncbi:MAG TPA: hypothetical protein VIU38_12915 [Anaerolineales bacterium]